MRFSNTLITDYSVPEPENERSAHLHAETRKAYLVCHRFLSREDSKVRKLHLLLGISSTFYERFSVRRRSWSELLGRGLRNGTSINIPWKENLVYNEAF